MADEPATAQAVDAQTTAIEISQAEITGITESVAPVEEKIDEAQIEVIPYQNIKTGMVVRVHEKIKDITAKGERERVQVFQGIVMGVRGSGISRTTTIRKDSKGWMVEKIFALSSPNIEKIEVVKQYRVRRAQLSYLRDIFKRTLKEVK